MSQTDPTAPPEDPTAPAPAPDAPQPDEPPADPPAPDEPPADAPQPDEPPADAPAPDEPPADAPQPDEPPAPPEARGVDAGALQQLERELDRHWKKVSGIMGPDFDTFVPCPQCEAAQSPLGGLIPIGAVAPTIEYVQDPTLEACPDCRALGERLTGSMQAHNRLKLCTTCNGQGYVTKPGSPPPANVHALVPQGQDPRVAELMAEGFTVIAPYVPPVPAAG